jgi:hypothetical protein
MDTTSLASQDRAREMAKVTPIRSKDIDQAQVALEREYHRHRALLTDLLDDLGHRPSDCFVSHEQWALMAALADHHRAALDDIRTALSRLDVDIASLDAWTDPR